MAWFVRGLGYGVLALGWLLSFSGGIIVIVSLCSFMSWIGDRIAGTDSEDGEDAGEDTQDE